MNKKKPIDKEQLRERRNRMLDTAAAAQLSLIEGVREMRAITGMTQEEFARHRGVSARVIKALELGQGNPTVATLNRIGSFFGLEVAFVPVNRPQDKKISQADNGLQGDEFIERRHVSHVSYSGENMIGRSLRDLNDLLAKLGSASSRIDTLNETLKRAENLSGSLAASVLSSQQVPSAQPKSKRKRTT